MTHWWPRRGMLGPPLQSADDHKVVCLELPCWYYRVTCYHIDSYHGAVTGHWSTVYSLLLETPFFFFFSSSCFCSHAWLHSHGGNFTVFSTSCHATRAKKMWQRDILTRAQNVNDTSRLPRDHSPLRYGTLGRLDYPIKMRRCLFSNIFVTAPLQGCSSLHLLNQT